MSSLPDILANFQKNIIAEMKITVTAAITELLMKIDKSHSADCVVNKKKRKPNDVPDDAQMLIRWYDTVLSAEHRTNLRRKYYGTSRGNISAEDKVHIMKQTLNDMGTDDVEDDTSDDGNIREKTQMQQVPPVAVQQQIQTEQIQTESQNTPIDIQSFLVDKVEGNDLTQFYKRLRST